MAVKTAKRKDPAAVALGRKGGKRGGPARAAKLTPEQRSASARKAVTARWAKVKKSTDYTKVKRATMERNKPTSPAAADNSDQAVLSLLKRIKATDDPTEIRKLSDQLERVIFHKQYENSKS